jgi:hypothetical protein
VQPRQVAACCGEGRCPSQSTFQARSTAAPAQPACSCCSTLQRSTRRSTRSSRWPCLCCLLSTLLPRVRQPCATQVGVGTCALSALSGQGSRAQTNAALAAAAHARL